MKEIVVVSVILVIPVLFFMSVAYDWPLFVILSISLALIVDFVFVFDMFVERRK